MNTAQLDLEIKQSDAVEDLLDKKHVFNTVDKSMPVQYREDWIRLVNNLKLPKVRRDILIEVIIKIFKENNIDQKAWETVD